MQFSVRIIISLIIAGLASAAATFIQGGQFPDVALLATVSIATLATAIAVGLVPGSTKDSTSPRQTRQGTTAKPGREQGTVKWFNSAKGFGFITRDDGEEIFVHFRSIRGEGRRSLQDGQRVAFHTASSNKGPQAEDVEILAKGN